MILARVLFFAEKKAENNPKIAWERLFSPEKIFLNIHPRNPKQCPRKKMKNCTREAHKVPEKNTAQIFLQVYFA